jgi:hypothetical protein
MNDHELIEILRRERPLPPPAPAGEWASIAARVRPRPPFWSRFRMPVLAVGGLALAGMALSFWPVSVPVQPQENEAAALAGLLDEASLELASAPVSPADDYLALLDEVN